MYKRIPGTKDILPEEAYRWQRIEEISRNIFSLYNYKEVRTPVIEEYGLFNRSLGGLTEVVQKQMFLIDKGEEAIALRPEGTASIARAYIENNLDKAGGFMKLYYTGAMFRRERPQKGRLRQFHHIGCEAVGSSDARVDLEVISLASELLKAFTIAGFEIKINSLGCPNDRNELKDILHKHLKDKSGSLCEDCKVRFKQNVLRILDCKNDACKETVKELDIHDTHLCRECKSHFNEVKAGLTALNINYKIVPCLVRGLDYYTRTVFEISHSQLGAQDALGAGGRYDNLISELGGRQTAAMGFAFGIERLLLVSGIQHPVSRNLVYIIFLGEEARKQNLKLLYELRSAGIAADTDYENKSLKGALRKADDLKARFAAIIGENELKNNTVSLKDMVSGEQKEIKIKDLIDNLKNVKNSYLR